MELQIEKFSEKLRLNSQEIYTLDLKQKVSYPAEGSDLCFEVEDSSFWFSHRKNCILEVVKKLPPKDKGLIFDIGGGNGFMTDAFNREGFPSVLVEPSSAGVLNAKKYRGVNRCIHSTFEEAAFNGNSLSAASAFDVIEHIADDQAFITQVHHALKKEGRFYITVPAHSWLWSSADDLGGHFRRYTLGQMVNLLEKVGFKIDYSTYFFYPLIFPIFLFRALPYRLMKKQLSLSSKQNNKDHNKTGQLFKLVQTALNAEFKKIQSLSKLNYGASCLICCSKK